MKTRTEYMAGTQFSYTVLSNFVEHWRSSINGQADLREHVISVFHKLCANNGREDIYWQPECSHVTGLFNDDDLPDVDIETALDEAYEQCSTGRIRR